MTKRRARRPASHWAELVWAWRASGKGALRAERSLPTLAVLEKWVGAHDGKLPPKSLLARAVYYAKHQ